MSNIGRHRQHQDITMIKYWYRILYKNINIYIHVLTSKNKTNIVVCLTARCQMSGLNPFYFGSGVARIRCTKLKTG